MPPLASLTSIADLDSEDGGSNSTGSWISSDGELGREEEREILERVTRMVSPACRADLDTEVCFRPLAVEGASRGGHFDGGWPREPSAG